jgi:hypothetical protein
LVFQITFRWPLMHLALGRPLEEHRAVLIAHTRGALAARRVGRGGERVAAPTTKRDRERDVADDVAAEMRDETGH